MNTKNIKDKEERKKLKRAARKKQAAKPKRTEPRGSRKPKVKKKGPGVAPTPEVEEAVTMASDSDEAGGRS